MKFESYNMGKMYGLGVGVMTFLSMAAVSPDIHSSMTSTLNNPYKYEGIYLCSDDNLCTSSVLVEKAIGDVVCEKSIESDFVSTHEKYGVQIKVNQIKKHISTFDFEEEYEEI